MIIRLLTGLAPAEAAKYVHEKAVWLSELLESDVMMAVGPRLGYSARN